MKGYNHNIEHYGHYQNYLAIEITRPTLETIIPRKRNYLAR